MKQLVSNHQLSTNNTLQEIRSSKYFGCINNWLIASKENVLAGFTVTSRQGEGDTHLPSSGSWCRAVQWPDCIIKNTMIAILSVQTSLDNSHSASPQLQSATLI